MKLGITQRSMRQLDIIPEHKLADLGYVMVIGVGAIGRQVAIQAASLGVRKLALVDFDTVEPVNLATQGYYEDDLGKPKVTVTANICEKLNQDIKVLHTQSRFEDLDGVPNFDVVFCCVDSIDARLTIWQKVRKIKKLWVDGRMLGETMRVLTTDGNNDRYYRSTIFPGREAEKGRCTARATIYTSNIIAGLMLSQFNRWLREEPFQADIMFNLTAMDMFFPHLTTAAA